LISVNPDRSFGKAGLAPAFLFLAKAFSNGVKTSRRRENVDQESKGAIRFNRKEALSKNCCFIAQNSGIQPENSQFC